MDREQRERANKQLHEALRAKLEANRGGITLEDLMGRERDQEGEAPPEQEDAA
jgi:hypothetical protein